LLGRAEVTRPTSEPVSLALKTEKSKTDKYEKYS